VVTISEHLQRQVRNSQRVKWTGVLAVVVVAFVAVSLKRSNAETYVWMAVVVVPWLAALAVFGKRVKCPRCQKNLSGDLASTVASPLTLLRDAKREVTGRDPIALEACPQCGCRFSEPYVGG
jgi:hypothetical protein